MKSLCLQCHFPLEPAFKFCPACAAPIPHKPLLPQEHEKAPVQASFSGLLFGLIAAPVMLIVGAMLCLTGLGVFVGVPMIIGGILAPLIGPLVGFVSLRGKCPWCGASVTSLNSSQSFACDACHRRIAIRNEKFVTSV
ncbi:MAG TPA: hypothetical protein VMU48_15840 [Terracidiphilus sp.]|nr:hypothetical protein [Terracidiphilus sp.]